MATINAVEPIPTKALGNVTEATVLAPSSRPDVETAGRPSTEPIHFNWLTELRFLANFGVIFFHIQSLLFLSGIPVPPCSHLLTVCGEQGVQFFFSMSGFLITHLLLTELSRSGTISVSSFYTRRALRIAPLYYALLMVSLLVVPFIAPTDGKTILDGWFAQTFNNFGIKFTLFMTLLANLNLVLFPPVMGIAQAWSLGVEEQFYLMWPVLTKVFKKIPCVAFIAVLSLKIMLQLSVLSVLASEPSLSAKYHINLPSVHAVLTNLSSFLYTFHIETLAFGGIAAYLLHRYPARVTALARNPLVAIAVFSGLYAIWFIPGITQPSFYYSDILLACFVVICSISRIQAPGVLKKILIYGGKTSYGIYMFHPMVCLLSIKLLFVMGVDRSSAGFVVGTAVMTTVATLAVASLSYECFESRFLRLKKKFAAVPTSVS